MNVSAPPIPAEVVAGAAIPETVANIPRSGAHVPELDGIRALAIWLVLGTHLLFARETPAAGRAFIPQPFFWTVKHGWLGVDLFFVLSGFLITGILLRTKGLGPGHYFRRFYLARTLRILPLYFVILAVLYAAYGGHFGSYFALCALLSANLAGLTSMPVPDAAGPFWSLAVEEQFYLVWPWLVLWLDARSLIRVALAVLVLEPFVRLFASEADLIYTWYRIDGLAMGALLAAWFAVWDGDPRAARNLALQLAGIAIAISIFGQPFGINHEGPASTSFRITQGVCVFGALLVTAVAFSGHPGLGCLRSRFAVATAGLSYCLYLVHRPLADLFTSTAGATAWFEQLPPVAGTLLRLVVVVAVAYALAALSRRFIERPFQRLGMRRRA